MKCESASNLQVSKFHPIVLFASQDFDLRSAGVQRLLKTYPNGALLNSDESGVDNPTGI